MADGSGLNIASLKGRVSEAEWKARVELAALYRLVAMFGWDDLVDTHISARVPGPEHHFLLNPYGLFWDEITASSLVRIDVDGTSADAIANLMLQCPTEGEGWVSVFAPLPSTAQGPDAASVAGLAANLDVTLTDVGGETASQSLGLVLAAE